MTREQIEKAAGEYSGSVLGLSLNPVVMNKHKAFMDGAQWLIHLGKIEKKPMSFMKGGEK